MKVKKSYRYLLIPLFLVFFVGCGGSGADNATTVNNNQREVSGISNIRLKKAIHTTTTNNNPSSTSKLEVTYEYDSSNLLKYTNYDSTMGADFVINHIYDSNNYMVKMIGSHGYDVKYEYDDKGRMVKRSDLNNGVLFEEISVVKWDNNNPIELEQISHTRNGANINIKNRFTDNELTHAELSIFNSNFNATSIFDTTYDLHTYHPRHYVNVGLGKPKEGIKMSYYYNKMPIEVNVIGNGGRKILFSFTKNSKGLVTEIEELTTYDSGTRIVVNSSYEYEEF